MTSGSQVDSGRVAAIARRGLEIMDAQEFERLAEVMHDDVKWMVGGVTVDGPEGIGQFLGGFYTAFPDARHEVLAVVEEGDAVALELRVKATHGGAFPSPVGEIAATGRSVEWASGTFVRVRDGKIESWRGYNEIIDILVQIGALEGL